MFYPSNPWRSALSSPAASNRLLRESMQGKSIAIVGNARSLKQARHGHLIDRNDIVVRLNSAPGATLASHGAKTTWLATSQNVSSARLRQLNPTLILWMTPKNRWRIWHLRFRGWSVIAYPVSRWRSSTRLVEGARPSTGFMVVEFLHGLGGYAELTLFGFDFFKSGSLSKRKTDACIPHDFQKEQEAVIRLFSKDERHGIVS